MHDVLVQINNSLTRSMGNKTLIEKYCFTVDAQVKKL